MATECSQEAILDFLRLNGGKVKNADLIDRFRAAFPEEPERKAAARDCFKNCVDNVAFVRSDGGVKYVCLKKKFRCSEKDSSVVCNGTETAPVQVLEQDKLCRYVASPDREARGKVHAQTARQQHLPGSGYGSDSQVRVPHTFLPATILPDKTDCRSERHEFVCLVGGADSGSGEMGNVESFRRDRRQSKKVEAGKAPDIPEIAVIEASPLLAEGPMFTAFGPEQTGTTGQVDTAVTGLDPRDRETETKSLSPEGPKEVEQSNAVLRRRTSKGSQRRSRQSQPDDEDDVDTHSLSGSEGNSTPKCSRKHFIEVMVNSSPHVRRSMVLRSSVYLPSRSESDSTSLVSSVLEDDRTSITLDPLEHEWMMCASDGEWGSMRSLLTTEPSLVLRKDFVTGFTCLHWAAKQDNPELIALIINFAKQHDINISVDVRSNSGYTPLHVAAMHNHMEVVKLLVGAYSADVEIRDYSGRKACQYLTDNVSVDIRDIIGAYEQSDSENADRREGGRWRFSKVLQSNLKPLRLLHPNDCDSVDGEVRLREKPLRRKSSLSRMKPKLQRLRVRTSQILHSTSFHDVDELDGSEKSSFKSRPKTHFFG